MTTSNDIRTSFLEFFHGKGHALIESSPLVPRNDPTLMFTNSGMVQFKNTFTGLETRPYKTATTSQKCVRAGGKHNDLDNVGYTARHHTFFEMLGNFSFGDYFKDHAIAMAWELITKIWGISPDRLCVTVYHNDDEAAGLWRTIAGLPESRIIRIATKDNFWSMGETGPCGPCSEIFYDHGAHIPGGPPGSPEQDGDRFVEIWNLVFMQYEQMDDGSRTSLPRPSIDTGMGLERVAAVLQGHHDNYQIDTFTTLIHAIMHHAGHAQDSHNASYKVIADHVRAASFLIADGVLPSNDGRGYVLRRIMRRAMRHAHLLGIEDPIMHRLVPTLTSLMGAAYPELSRAGPLITETLKLEEIHFRRTLANGLRLLDDARKTLAPGATFPGETAFKLYDTYGFPYDLTEDALRACGHAIDKEGFDGAMAKQKAAARAAWKGSGEKADDGLWFDLAQEFGATEFIGYTAEHVEGQILALIKEGRRVDTLTAGESATILVNQTPFYGESGGQMGDIGLIQSTSSGAHTRAVFNVTDTQKPLGVLHSHIGTLGQGTVHVGDAVTLTIDSQHRAKIRANHSATHLLHAALRDALGPHVTQKGSLVAPDRLRFDIAHPKPISPEDIAAIEADVNARIRQNSLVHTTLMTPEDALAAGAMALFGEKYGEEVRVLSMGERESPSVAYSLELCGGTHVTRLGDIGLFKIIQESAVAAGVRRIEALTGEAARLYLVEQDQRIKDLAATLKTAPSDVTTRVAHLMATARRLEKDLADAKKTLVLGRQNAVPETINGLTVLSAVYDGLDPKDVRPVLEQLAPSSGVAAIVATHEDKASIAVAVSDDLTARVSAVDLVRIGVSALGGQGGGGRPNLAQGGGPRAEQADQALADIKASLAER